MRLKLFPNFTRDDFTIPTKTASALLSLVIICFFSILKNNSREFSWQNLYQCHFPLLFLLFVDVSGGESSSMLVAMRDCIKASNVLSLNKSDGYTPLTFKEAFFLATLGGCQGKLPPPPPSPAPGNTCRMFGHCLHTFKCLNRLGASYLSDLVTRYLLRRNLRSANSRRLLDIRYISAQLWSPVFLSNVTTVVE